MGESAKKKPRLPKAEEEPTFDPDPIVLSSDDEANDDLSLKIVENGNPSSSSLKPQVKKKIKKTKERKMGAQDNAVSTSNPVEKVDFYKASLTLRSAIYFCGRILRRLSEIPARLALFRQTCFGPYLDLVCKKQDPLLVHVMLQTQIEHQSDRPDELWFRTGERLLRFSQEEFCLITGLRFGPAEEVVRLRTRFRRRVFPEVPMKTSVKVSDILGLFVDERAFERLADDDAVRVCLLLLLVVGFAGREHKQSVLNLYLHLVEDFGAWDRYPWGSHLWALTYPQLYDALKRRDPKRTGKHKLPTYSLTGFVYAFEIWILEMSSFTQGMFTSHDMIPRVVSWRRTRAISFQDCIAIVDAIPNHPPPTEMTPMAAEMTADWWISSRHFFDEVVRSPPRQPVPQAQPLRQPVPQAQARRQPLPQPQAHEPSSHAQSQHHELPPYHNCSCMAKVEHLKREVKQIIRHNRRSKASFVMIRRLLGDQCPIQSSFSSDLSDLDVDSEAIDRESERREVEPIDPVVHKAEVRSEDTRPCHVDDDVPKVEPSTIVGSVAERTPPLGAKVATTLLSSHTILPSTTPPVRATQWVEDHVQEPLVFALNDSSESIECYIRSLPGILCDKDFWGKLLGRNSNNWLDGEHIHAWITILLESRPAYARWTAMEPSFLSFLDHRVGSLHLADGSTPPYAGWWDVDRVSIFTI